MHVVLPSPPLPTSLHLPLDLSLYFLCSVQTYIHTRPTRRYVYTYRLSCVYIGAEGRRKQWEIGTTLKYLWNGYPFSPLLSSSLVCFTQTGLTIAQWLLSSSIFFFYFFNCFFFFLVQIRICFGFTTLIDFCLFEFWILNLFRAFAFWFCCWWGVWLWWICFSNRIWGPPESTNQLIAQHRRDQELQVISEDCTTKKVCIKITTLICFESSCYFLNFLLSEFWSEF